MYVCVMYMIIIQENLVKQKWTLIKLKTNKINKQLKYLRHPEKGLSQQCYYVYFINQSYKDDK